MTHLETVNKDHKEIKEESNSLWLTAWKKYKKNKLAIVGAFILLFFIFLAIFANLIAPSGYTEQNLSNALQSPSFQNWFGTDEFGRDIFSRIIHGSRISLMVGFTAVAGAVFIGTVLGILAGYYGRWVDIIISRLFDIMLAFPTILLAIAIVAILGPAIENVLVAVGTVQIPIFGRLVRSTVLSIKEEEYIMAAKSLGMKDVRILFRHILPNSLTPIIVQASLNFATAILNAAALGFLGLGAQAPQPEWGTMLADAQEYMLSATWVVTFPGLAIMLLVISLNFVGDGLRDALDPTMQD